MIFFHYSTKQLFMKNLKIITVLYDDNYKQTWGKKKKTFNENIVSSKLIFLVQLNLRNSVTLKADLSTL